jgi:hypothetical protein
MIAKITIRLRETGSSLCHVNQQTEPPKANVTNACVARLTVSAIEEVLYPRMTRAALVKLCPAVVYSVPLAIDYYLCTATGVAMIK